MYSHVMLFNQRQKKYIVIIISFTNLNFFLCGVLKIAVLMELLRNRFLHLDENVYSFPTYVAQQLWLPKTVSFLVVLTKEII